MSNYVNILKYAMDREKEGKRFFEENAGRFASPVSKALFKRLAEVEQEHYDFLKEQLDYYAENNKVKEISAEIEDKKENIFISREENEQVSTSLTQSDVPDLAIMRMAYLIEKDFAEFYREEADKAADFEAKRLFTILAKWEEDHEAVFKEEHRRLMKEYMSLPWGG